MTAELLSEKIQRNRAITLSEEQKVKLLRACQKTIDDHEGETEHGLLIAANIYLDFILAHPLLELDAQ
jgi:hypothetical protein